MSKILKIYSLSIFFTISLLIFLVFVFSIRPAIADGIGIGISGEIIPEVAQKAVIIWNEDDDEEILVLNASFGIDSLTNFSWIIPILSDKDPDVRASYEVFDYLEDIFPVYVITDWNRYSPSYGYGASGSGIEVIQTQKIGVYDLATVWADDADILINWLESYNYEVTNAFKNRLDDYFDENDESYFVVNKINLQNEFSSPLGYLQQYNLGIYNKLMADETDLADVDGVIDDLKYDIAQDIKDNKAYKSKSFIGSIMDKDDYEDLMDDWKDDKITSSKLRSEIEEFLMESELFETIYKLFDGAGTPIEITFYPENPIYPLYLTSKLYSIFAGIDVYFIGPDVVADKNNILTRWAYLNFTSSIESDLEDMLDLEFPDDSSYITHLIYRGYMDDIDDDSVFVEYTPPSTPAPYYPFYPYYPYSPTIMPPYSYPMSMPYSFPTLPTYSFPSLYGSFSFNRPSWGSGFFGSFFGGLYGGGYNWPFASSFYSKFPGSFTGLYGSSFFPSYKNIFGGLYGSGFFPGYSRSYWPF